MAVEWIISNEPENRILICSNSQSLLKAIENDFEVTCEIRAKLLQVKIAVIIQWVPAYVNIPASQEMKQLTRRLRKPPQKQTILHRQSHWQQLWAVWIDRSRTCRSSIQEPHWFIRSSTKLRISLKSRHATMPCSWSKSTAWASRRINAHAYTGRGGGRRLTFDDRYRSGVSTEGGSATSDDRYRYELTWPDLIPLRQTSQYSIYLSLRDEGWKAALICYS